MSQFFWAQPPCDAIYYQLCTGLNPCTIILVENARKFRESAPNQIPMFGKPPPRVGVSENVWFFKFKCVDRANMRYI